LVESSFHVRNLDKKGEKTFTVLFVFAPSVFYPVLSRSLAINLLKILTFAYHPVFIFSVSLFLISVSLVLFFFSFSFPFSVYIILLLPCSSVHVCVPNITSKTISSFLFYDRKIHTRNFLFCSKLLFLLFCFVFSSTQKLSSFCLVSFSCFVLNLNKQVFSVPNANNGSAVYYLASTLMFVIYN
jgi:hypothetical protein